MFASGQTLNFVHSKILTSGSRERPRGSLDLPEDLNVLFGDCNSFMDWRPYDLPG
jgi:hypothetical protein